MLGPARETLPSELLLLVAGCSRGSELLLFLCVSESAHGGDGDSSVAFVWCCAGRPRTARPAHSRYSGAISAYEGDKIAKMEGSRQNESLGLSHES